MPIQVACKWIGNSVPIAAKYYLQTTDEHFELVLGKKPAEPEPAPKPEKDIPNPAHQLATRGHKEPSSKSTAKNNPRELWGNVTRCDSVHKQTVLIGLEANFVTGISDNELHKNEIAKSAKSGVTISDAILADPLLVRLAQIWPDLPPPIRAQIVALCGLSDPTPAAD